MFNWTPLSSNPNHGPTIESWTKFYNSISKLVMLPERTGGKTHHDFILDLLDVKGRILDIGIAEHTLENVGKDSWFHRKLRALEPDNEVWGIDINAAIIEHLRKQYNWERLLTHDATAAAFRSGYFDIVHAGDVIEHVGDVGRFLAFCSDSLRPGGALVILTPNPHAWEFIKRIRRYGGTIPANLEHTCWITPPSMNELCRRYGFIFEAAYYLCGKQKTRRAKILGKNFYFKFRDFLWYEFVWVLRKPQASVPSAA
jgi:SAM-dependent methyltransferase